MYLFIKLFDIIIDSPLTKILLLQVFLIFDIKIHFANNNVLSLGDIHISTEEPT